MMVPKMSLMNKMLSDLQRIQILSFFITEEHQGDWGHWNRDRGIRVARGEWIIHTNADNLFYPELIEVLKEYVNSVSLPVTTLKQR